MAERKTGKTEKKSPGRADRSRNMSLQALFWIIFFIVIAGLFFRFSPEIKKNWNILTQSVNLPARTEPARDIPQESPGEPYIPPPEPLALPVSPPAPAVEKTADPPPAVQPAATVPQNAPAKPAPEKPAARPASPPAAPPPAAAPESRDRNIYFTQIDKDGVVFRTKTSRKIPVSDSPMLDSLNAMLAGPNAEEKKRGIISFIPPNTRVLSAIVRGSTAYISFNEDFQYNTYGVEGYAAQLKQVVWTATEFSNINDVQILIEGRRVDYLGEGIWIGSPVSRASL
jgi:type IV secretory pathway VirB10-like protein